MNERASSPPPEFFDDQLAAQMVGRSLLIGITEEAHTGEFIGRRQVFGRVLTADRQKGICVRTEKEGFEFWLPPDTRGVKPAAPGEYRNRATGEVVLNPDYLASIRITKASGEGDAT